MNFLKLCKDSLDVGAIYNSVVDSSCGAVSLFVGTTRDTFNGRPVLQLEYEAYDSMVLKELEALANLLRAKFQVHHIAINHRLGVVPVTEASVVIAISSPHREASLKAVSFAIDQLKANIPIFKKEVYGDSEPAQWKENNELSVIESEVATAEDTSIRVNSELVQVVASAQEIKRRIESFQRRKREESNQNNLQDFCFHGAPIMEKENSCARVDAVLIRNKGAKSHLKVSCVQNLVGPQLGNEEQTPFLHNGSAMLTEEPYGVPKPVNELVSCPAGAEERLTNAEQFLGISANQQDVFTRLKDIEDRILFLESVSPEYFNVSPKRKKIVPNLPERKRSISPSELDRKMLALEKQLQSKYTGT